MEKYRWALFDADHTLFDFDKASEEALSEVLAEHGAGLENGMYADYKRINVQCWLEHEQGLIKSQVFVYNDMASLLNKTNVYLSSTDAGRLNDTVNPPITDVIEVHLDAPLPADTPVTILPQILLKEGNDPLTYSPVAHRGVL